MGNGRSFRYDERGNVIGVTDMISNPSRVGPELFPDAQYYTGLQPVSIETADFNNDGFDDVATTSAGLQAITVFLGNGDGSFAERQDFAVGDGVRFVESADINNDGVLDLITANQRAETITVLIGNGDGTFGRSGDFSVDVSPVGLTLADFNNDGNVDVATASGGTGGIGGTTTILFGDGLGNFFGRQDYRVGDGPLTIASGDADGDGDVDLVVGHLAGFFVILEPISILWNNGDGTF